MSRGGITSGFIVSLLGTLLLPGCAGVSVAPADNGTQYVLSYAENQKEEYPTTRGAQYFASKVEEKTNGKVKINIFPEAQLGDETSTIEQLTFGGIDFTRVSLATLTDYSEEAVVLMMPYLYRDSDHMWRVLDGGIGDEVMTSFEGSGIVPLSWYDAGVRSFYTAQRVDSLAGMKGLSIRVQPSALMEDTIRALGADPVPVEFENVYSALQTGEVDGAENNWSSYEAMDHYNVAPYYMEDEHTRIPELQIMSESTREKLPEEYLAVIDECAKDSAEYERRLWQEQEDAAKEKVLSSGCSEIKISSSEKEKFKEAVEPLYEQYCAGHMDLVNDIRETE